ncbi:helix-turn-helix domain-containing protein [Phascolarctobacterium faecium]|uniref:helix-turn-helix domain-containing protein n=4 Tax=Phascolarctobacterium faecium TaxID=33025 RepID=UPI00210D46E5|nr:helix-turn-helix transcriptional regulator [Phascolarctobacterium faecium]MCQ5184610.1 helix-turn-helix domain-containing protein [Phascolarctobacterium faecium]
MYDESCLLSIGSNIRLLRSTCRLKQQQFAERIGISQTHLSNIEHNNVQVSLKLLVRSANVLGCSLETLLDRKAAAEWAPVHGLEVDEQAAGAKSKSVFENIVVAETDEQEQYSLEEVRLLLKLLQLGKGRRR